MPSAGLPRQGRPDMEGLRTEVAEEAAEGEDKGRTAGQEGSETAGASPPVRERRRGLHQVQGQAGLTKETRRRTPWPGQVEKLGQGPSKET